jgi:undecaprenyl-diphosphatase
MNTLNQLLALDLSLLEWSRTLVSPEYARLVQISGELVVIYGAILLVGLWLYGVYRRDNQYKRTALAIFITIVSVFVLYAIINLGIPKWRPGATEMAGAIAPLIPHPIDNSFPSGHALFTGALLVALFRYFRVQSLITMAIIMAIITLVARVIGGIHYPGDIIAGLIFGALGAYLPRPVVDRSVVYIAPIVIKIASWVRL